MKKYITASFCIICLLAGFHFTRNRARFLEPDGALKVYGSRFISLSAVLDISDDANEVYLQNHDVSCSPAKTETLWRMPKGTGRCQNGMDFVLSQEGVIAALAIPRDDSHDDIALIHLLVNPSGVSFAKMHMVVEDEYTYAVSLALGHDGKRIAWTDRNTINTLDIDESGEVTNRKELEKPFGNVNYLRFHPHFNNILASSHGLYFFGQDSADNPGIAIWNLNDGSCEVLPDRLAGDIEFSPSGKLLAVGDDEGSIRLYEWKTGSCKKIIPTETHSIADISFSPDGDVLAALCSKSDKEESVGGTSIMLWSFPRTKFIAELKCDALRIQFDQTGYMTAGGDLWHLDSILGRHHNNAEN